MFYRQILGKVFQPDHQWSIIVCLSNTSVADRAPAKRAIEFGQEVLKRHFKIDKDSAKDNTLKVLDPSLTNFWQGQRGSYGKVKSTESH